MCGLDTKLWPINASISIEPVLHTISTDSNPLTVVVWEDQRHCWHYIFKLPTMLYFARICM